MWQSPPAFGALVAHLRERRHGGRAGHRPNDGGLQLRSRLSARARRGDRAATDEEAGVKYGSLFTGIAGIDLGLERAGMTCAWQVQNDPVCLRVLARHYLEVERHGDIGRVRTDALAPVDLVCGGFPCQDLSVAGRRAGLGGERSGLFYEFVRLADSQPAAWILVENVPGLLSSQGGEDFALVLSELTGFCPEVPDDGWRSAGCCAGPKRTVAWRVLDSQYFGVAQRRARVFLVGGPPACGSGPVEVLLEPDGVPWNPPARGTARRPATDVAASLRSGGETRRGWLDDTEQG